MKLIKILNLCFICLMGATYTVAQTQENSMDTTNNNIEEKTRMLTDSTSNDSDSNNEVEQANKVEPLLQIVIPLPIIHQTMLE